MRKFNKKKFVNLTKKVRKCEENMKKKDQNVRKRPEFYKKHWGATPVAPLWVLPL